MNFIFQMYRQRFQNTTFCTNSTIYRQQDIKLEKLKQGVGYNSLAFVPPPNKQLFLSFPDGSTVLM